ncbi:MAG: proton-conducting transporter membrane subunit [Candidatus Micrarchaeota archaeon]|nr:proton-conducting transporter membrane subunit [Candidatus Micrarchaeota archaeon]
MLELIILPPIICGLLAFLFSKRPRVSEIVAIAGVLLAAFFALFSVWSFLQSPVGFTDFYGFLYMDSISALFTALTTVVAVFVFIYSIGYIRHEVEEKSIEEHKIGEYYGLLSFFLAVMLLATLAANIVVMWAFIEATTLASVFLISFYNTSNSIEAAWKFFIINSVGILLALVGIMFLLYAVLQPGLESHGDWVSLLALHSGANIFFLKIAFAFIIVGFGTKVGFAPLHVWLPDAHSQAPTPVSALLSGVLLNIAFYGIVRAYMIISPYPELVAFASNLLIVFGLLSLVIGALRLYFQDNLKRMLAYSSVENMGIVALALGLGGPIGIFAALFHMVSHSLAKSLAFLTSGMVAFAFGTKEIRLIRGAAQKIPLVAIPFVFIAIGIAGSPPFGTFFSEIGILAVSLSAGQLVVAAIFIIFTTITFASLLYRTSGMCFGEKSENATDFTPDITMMFSFIALLVLAIYFGIAPPGEFIKLLQLAVQAIKGG